MHLESEILEAVLLTTGRRFRIRQEFLVSTILPAFLLIALALPAFGAAKKVIIDTDPGTDDAMALMLALNSPELDVRAVTVVPGNVTAKHPGSRRCPASALSKADHSRVLARQEWACEYRIAAQQMQGRFPLGPRPDH
jgi:hypothetical protein